MLVQINTALNSVPCFFCSCVRNIHRFLTHTIAKISRQFSGHIFSNMLLELIIFIVTFIIVATLRQRGKGTDGSPPGPPGLPLLGHMLFLGQLPHKTLLKWSQHYGPVLSIRFGTTPVIVINNGQLIRKVLSSANLAGRPFIKSFDEASLRAGIVLGDEAANREQRQFISKYLKEYGARGGSIESRIHSEIESLLAKIESLGGKPVEINNFFFPNVLNLLLRIMLSKRFSADDPVADQFARSFHEAARIDGVIEQFGTWVPAFGEWFPDLVGLSKRIKAVRSLQSLIQAMIDEHKASLVRGKPRDPTDAYLELLPDASGDSGNPHFSELRLLMSLFDLFVAGTDTTSNTIEFCIYYMAKYEDIQRKLQEEIDRVVGHERQPELSDRSRMTYTEAFVQEIFRVSSVVPLGIFHRATAEDTVGGYCIRKEMTVVANIYAAHHEPSVWGDPENFRPERFIEADGRELRRVEELVPFSWGRRACIGENLGRSHVFLYVTSILQRFNVRKSGTLPPPDGFGVTLQPAPFKVCFEKRKF